MTLECQKALGSEQDEAISRITSMTAERNSANARYHEVFAALGRIVEEKEDERDESADTLLTIRELFDHGRKMTVPIHPSELAELRTKSRL